MSERERREVEQRMLEVLLLEEFAAEEGADALPPPVLDTAPSSVTGVSVGATVGGGRRLLALPAAAAVLLGLAVVTMTMWSREAPPAALSDAPWQDLQDAQDPQGSAAPELVKAPDVETFMAWLAKATELRLVRKEAVGAGRVIDDDGASVDRLDTVRWPEVHRITGAELDEWRVAMRDSSTTDTRSNTIDEVYDLEMVLDGNRLVRCFVSWAGTNTRMWIAGDDPLVPNEALRDLFAAAEQSIEQRHRLTRGLLRTREEFKILPKQATRLDLSVELAADIRELPCAATVEHLCLRGEPDAAVWRAVAGLESLRGLELVGCTFDAEALDGLLKVTNLNSLVLRDCSGLTSASAGRLAALRRLERLHCIDTGLGGTDVNLSVLAALPELREFGLKMSGVELPATAIEVFLRTKLQRLLLVDIAGGIDLSVLGGLPSLRELVLVGPFEDDDVDCLVELRSLRRLVLRNTNVLPRGAERLRHALPDCQLDWRPNARWFDTHFAFEYVPPGGRSPDRR